MKYPNHSKFVLAGDIGGTKTNLGLFLKGKRRPLLKAFETYSSRKSINLEAIIRQFIGKHSAGISSACFGIAGPIINGKSKTTNLPWEVSETGIRRRFKWPHVRLMNDLTATAVSIPLLNNRELSILNKGKQAKTGNIALIAPGTGLGQALLVYSEGRYVPVASEGGHCDLSPNDNAQLELWRYLNNRYGHVSVERVLSGQGLLNIYSWLKDSGRYDKPTWLKSEILKNDPAVVISESALRGTNPLCVESLNVFVSILGAAAGNLALAAMTTGGVYLGGGIAPKILPKLKGDSFIAAFIDKGRFRSLVSEIPMKVILNDKAALLGAAHCALEI